MAIRTLTTKQLFEDRRERLGLRWVAGREGGNRRIRYPSAQFAGLYLTGF